jgi:hypothetical protein
MRTVPHRTVQHAHSTGMRRREASKGGQGRGARADKDGEQPGESSSAVSAQEQEHSGVTVSAQDWFESASYARERFVICGALQYTDASTRHQSTARGTGAKDALGRAPRALTTAECALAGAGGGMRTARTCVPHGFKKEGDLIVHRSIVVNPLRQPACHGSVSCVSPLQYVGVFARSQDGMDKTGGSGDEAQHVEVRSLAKGQCVNRHGEASSRGHLAALACYLESVLPPSRTPARTFTVWHERGRRCGRVAVEGMCQGK